MSGMTGFVRMMGLLLMVAGTGPVASAAEQEAADYDSRIAALEHLPGLIPLYLDRQEGRVFLSLPAPDARGVAGRYIHARYLTAGLGSNPVGLDRSLPTGSQLLRFDVQGKRVMAVVENTAFRADSPDAAERAAVRDSFARSIVWSGSVAARAPDTGRLLVDVTGFLVRDAIGVAQRLKDRGQGSYSLDDGRSFVDMNGVHAFPDNIEIDVTLTFKGTEPGRYVRRTTPVPEAVTLTAHSTLMRLPDDGYTPRPFDERAAMIGLARVDMAAPLGTDPVTRFARRFRLSPQNPDDPESPIRPITFYVDRGAPEPIRSALVEGASWWADAFAAAGYDNAFQVKLLPEGVHPLDARYNVINWVHRATRGWSYGMPLADPRTGEILRGVVLLGSLRVRQDIAIFEALLGADATGSGADDDPVELALDRIRQLAAHEVGHALGFAHNMAASTNDRASVMDYPAPLIRVGADGLDVSRAYDAGIGRFDKWAARFLYARRTDGANTPQALIRELDEGGLAFVSDADSRAVGTGHPRGGLWDTGSDPVASLKETLKVRAYALARFGMDRLRDGESQKALQRKFVPLYLYHRYQQEAAAKTLGGVTFAYRRRGDGRGAASMVPWPRQEAALNALLMALEPETLAISDPLVRALSPTGGRMGDLQYEREVFKHDSGPLFDPMAAARSAADLTLNAILAPRRAARLAMQRGGPGNHPGLEGVLARLHSALMPLRRNAPDNAIRLRKLVQTRYVARLLDLALTETHPAPVRAAARMALDRVRQSLARLHGQHEAHARTLLDTMDRAEARADQAGPAIPPAPDVPPGSPIGTGNGWHAPLR
ncbi:zinc-dependent metalloprotease [Yunchengibacter salinarum]|uniref:zinc-dependent metalloprotease n=1 Tax=Yunchengibacter salinarum TaxID=3133399 RepID=UPI0035B65DE6